MSSVMAVSTREQLERRIAEARRLADEARQEAEAVGHPSLAEAAQSAADVSIPTIEQTNRGRLECSGPATGLPR